jgi:hypothetical protein
MLNIVVQDIFYDKDIISHDNIKNQFLYDLYIEVSSFDEEHDYFSEGIVTHDRSMEAFFTDLFMKYEIYGRHFLDFIDSLSVLVKIISDNTDNPVKGDVRL